MSLYVKFSALVLSIVLISACKKTRNTEEIEPPEEPSIPLLRSIEWDNGLKGTFNYNNDSTIKEVNYIFANTGGSTVYQWTGKQLTEIYDSRSMYKNVYHYHNNGKLAYIMNTVRNGTSSTAYTLEFAYNAMGNLHSMKYFGINEAGKKLRTETSYHYDNKGDLHEILTLNNNISILQTIEEYSAPIHFNPHIFISAGLDEDYAIYNFPVMNQLKRLPAKLVRQVTEPGKPTYTEKIEAIRYSLTNLRIDSTFTTVTFPGMPASNSTLQAIYRY